MKINLSKIRKCLAILFAVSITATILPSTAANAAYACPTLNTRGVPTWWPSVEEIGTVVYDMSGCNLKGAYFKGRNLSGYDFRGANLRGANLSNTNLHNANFSGANLREANLYGAFSKSADFTNAYMLKANLTTANFSYANLFRANLSGAVLKRAVFLGADISDAKMVGADFNNAVFYQADLSGSNFLNVRNFSTAKFRNANLSFIDFQNVHFYNPFSDTFRCPQIDHVNFQYSSFTSGFPTECNVSYSDFSYAQLGDGTPNNPAILKTDKISHAKFVGAKMWFCGIEFNVATRVPINFTGAKMSGCGFTKFFSGDPSQSLSGLNLTNAIGPVLGSDASDGGQQFFSLVKNASDNMRAP